MELSSIGLEVSEYWLALPSYFPFVYLDDFIVMPDHFDGIISLDKSNLLKHPEHALAIKKLIGDNPMVLNGISKVTRRFRGRSTF